MTAHHRARIRPPALLLASAAAALVTAATSACDRNEALGAPSRPLDGAIASLGPASETGDAVAVVDGEAGGPANDGGAPARDPSVSGPVLHVAPASKVIHPTGHFDVNVWGSAANTHTLLQADGTGAVPVNEGRFLWGPDRLYVFFYAGDLDLEVRSNRHDGPVWKDDAVMLSFFPSPAADATDGGTTSPTPATKLVLAITPTGVVSDGACPIDAVDLGDPRCDLRWESGARVGTDYDGTINHLGDFDEEWAVEVALPLHAIGVDPAAKPPIRLSVAVRRCEMAYDGARACGLWGTAEHPGELVLDAR